MSELALTVRFGRALTDAEQESLDSALEAAEVGELDAVLTMGGDESVALVSLPLSCIDADLPARMEALRKVLAEAGFQATVDVAQDAEDDDEDDEDEDAGDDGGRP